jgi:hypothetical protein
MKFCLCSEQQQQQQVNIETKLYVAWIFRSFLYFLFYYCCCCLLCRHRHYFLLCYYVSYVLILLYSAWIFSLQLNGMEERRNIYFFNKSSEYVLIGKNEKESHWNNGVKKRKKLFWDEKPKKKKKYRFQQILDLMKSEYKIKIKRWSWKKNTKNQKEVHISKLRQQFLIEIRYY